MLSRSTVTPVAVYKRSSADAIADAGPAGPFRLDARRLAFGPWATGLSSSLATGRHVLVLTNIRRHASFRFPLIVVRKQSVVP